MYYDIIVIVKQKGGIVIAYQKGKPYRLEGKKTMNISIDTKSLEMLNKCAKQKNTSRAAVIREGIKLVEATLK